jgi:hypothetical protein
MIDIEADYVTTGVGIDVETFDISRVCMPGRSLTRIEAVRLPTIMQLLALAEVAGSACSSFG